MSAQHRHAPTVTRIRTARGVQLVACNADCAARWRFVHLPDGDPATIDTMRALMRWACAQCAWCGKTVARAQNRCELHGDVCPTVDWLLSDFARQSIRKMRRVGLPPLTDLGWNYLRAAGELHGANVPAVVASMVKLEAEWAADAA